MTAKRTPELAAAMLSSDECPHNKSAIPRPQNTCTECLEAALREQAEVAREERAAAERRGEERVRKALELQRTSDGVEMYMGFRDDLGQHQWRDFPKCELSDGQWWALTEEGAPPQEQPRIGGQPDGECPHGCLHQECRT